MGSSRQKTYRLLFSILSVLIFIYGFSKVLPMIRGPEIFVDGLRNGENHDPLAFISGKVTGATELRINDNEILLDELGNFNNTLLLSPGYNKISLVAKDTFGRTSIENFEITASDFYFPENKTFEATEDQKYNSEETILSASEEVRNEL